MIKKLQSDGYPDDVTRGVMTFLSEYHFVDDSAYTENYIHVNKAEKVRARLPMSCSKKG